MSMEDLEGLDRRHTSNEFIDGEVRKHKSIDDLVGVDVKQMSSDAWTDVIIGLSKARST